MVVSHNPHPQKNIQLNLLLPKLFCPTNFVNHDLTTCFKPQIKRFYFSSSTVKISRSVPKVSNPNRPQPSGPSLSSVIQAGSGKLMSSKRCDSSQWAAIYMCIYMHIYIYITRFYNLRLHVFYAHIHIYLYIYI